MKKSLARALFVFHFSFLVFFSRSEACEQELADLSAGFQVNESSTIYFLVGMPLAGKDTAGLWLSEQLQIPHESTGAILRQIRASGSELGQEIATFMDKGENIPTPRVLAVIESFLRKQNPQQGFILNGSPRRLNEAQSLVALAQNIGWKSIIAFHFIVDDKAIVERAAGRLVCPDISCARTYHSVFFSPKISGVCDYCQSPLEMRHDDADPKVVQQRIQTFRADTQPVVSYFRARRELIELRANESIQSVRQQIQKAIGQDNTSGR